MLPDMIGKETCQNRDGISRARSDRTRASGRAMKIVGLVLRYRSSSARDLPRGSPRAVLRAVLAPEQRLVPAVGLFLVLERNDAVGTKIRDIVARIVLDQAVRRVGEAPQIPLMRQPAALQDRGDAL